MKNQVTFGHLLAIMSILVLPLIGWGVSVETRFKDPIQNAKDIEENEKLIKEIQVQLTAKEKSDNDNFILVLEKLHNIELQLKDKKDK